MNTLLTDMIWSPLYGSLALFKFWSLVIGTIVIEAVVIKYFLQYGWIKSWGVSAIGNGVSGFIGTIIMLWGMLFWHSALNRFTLYSTFGSINWIATFVLLYFGSVFVETLTIRIIYKEKIKRLFIPMLIGNFLSYAFILWGMYKA